MLRLHLCFLLAVVVSAREVSIPDQLNALSRVFAGQVHQFAKTHLPRTYGNCAEADAPVPCEEGGNLYVEQGVLHRIKARWVSGLNDLHLRHFSVNIPLKNSNQLELSIMIEMAQLDLSLRLEACTFIKELVDLGGYDCVKLWDNHSACCGSSKRIWGKLLLTCTRNSTELLSNPRITQLGIDRTGIYNKIFGMYEVKLADITQPAADGLKEALEKALTTTDVMTQMNQMLLKLYGRFDLTCDSLLK